MRLSGHTPCEQAYRILSEGVPEGKHIYWATPTVPWHKRCGACDLICTNTTAGDCIEREYAARIPKVTLRDCDPAELAKITSTAEFSIGLLLALMRNIPQSLGSDERDRQNYIGNTLRGKVVLIVGYGRVGKQIAERLKPWGCEITTSDSDGETLLKLGHADIVFLCATASPENRGMFGEEQFDRMEQCRWLVNTARGELIDWRPCFEWVWADGGRFASDFPHGNFITKDFDKIYAARNCLFSPHLGGATVEDQEATEVLIARKVAECLSK